MDQNDGLLGIFEPGCKIHFLSDPKPEEEYIAISADRMVELLTAEMKLIALESGGVDNWSWYGESFRDYLNELPNCYGEPFWDWVRNEKTKDETVDDFVDSMDFEDYARFEVDVM